MAVKTGVTSASLGPTFSLTSLVSVTALKCSVSYQPGRKKMQLRAATPDLSGTGVCLQGVQGGASVLGTPRPGMEGAGAAACELAFLPLLRASYFAPVQPLCLPGARPC